MDLERRPENLLGVVLDAYWASLAGVLVVLLGHIVVDLFGQVVKALS